jgi:predicted hydrolase (HD superfamily)
MDVTRARDLARSLLEEQLPRRWRHSQGVAARADQLSPILGNHADLLRCAAWLHDIGYSPVINHAGFHPLDGARYLRDVEKAEPRLCNLVAHHTCALIEAEERSLDSELSREFDLESDLLVEALIYCDVTTTPHGEETTPEERLSEIRSRYGPGHVVTRSINRAEPHILDAVSSVRERMNSYPR